jgi:hypothetical protein
MVNFTNTLNILRMHQCYITCALPMLFLNLYSPLACITLYCNVYRISSCSGGGGNDSVSDGGGRRRRGGHGSSKACQWLCAPTQ